MKDTPPQPPVPWASPEPPAPPTASGGYSAYGPGPVPPSSGLSLGRYLDFLRRKWWLIVLTTLASVGVGIAYLVYWPAAYSSTAYLWIPVKVGVRMPDGSTTSDDPSFVGTQVELLQNPALQARAKDRVSDTLRLQAPIGPDGQPVLPKLEATQLPRSAVFEVKGKSSDAAYLQAFLNALMDEFLAIRKEVRTGASGDSFLSLSAQVDRYEKELKAEVDQLTTYQRENNIAVLEEQGKTAGAFLTQLSADYSRLKIESEILEAVAADKALSDSVSTNAFPLASETGKLPEMSLPAAGSVSAEAVNARQQLETLRIQRRQLGQYLRPKHPDMIQLDEEISRLEKLVDFFGQQNRDQLAAARETVRLRLPKIQEAIKEWEAKVSNSSQRLAELGRMRMNVQRVQGLYDRLLSLLQSVDVNRNLDQERFSVLQKASDPVPTKRGAPLVIGLTVVMGLGAGLALIFLVELLDDRLTSINEVSNRFPEWVVGQVPEVSNQRKKHRPALLERKDERHAFAESYRSLRSALLFGIAQESKPKTVLVTSAVPNEGKSTVAANLARTLTFSGSRVLLIDGDLRCGVLHELFDSPREPGLAELLASNDQLPPPAPKPYSWIAGLRPASSASLKPVSQSGSSRGNEARTSTNSEPLPTLDLARFVIPTALPNLFLLPCGSPRNGSGELLLTSRLDALLAQVRTQYDWVIMDSIPVFAADDTANLAPKMDCVLFVVRASFTSADNVRRALELLYERQARILGLVFNRSNSHSRMYRYCKYAEGPRPAQGASGETRGQAALTVS